MHNVPLPINGSLALHAADPSATLRRTLVGARSVDRDQRSFYELLEAKQASRKRDCRGSIGSDRAPLDGFERCLRARDRAAHLVGKFLAGLARSGSTLIPPRLEGGHGASDGNV
jgi:hypothetical protein